MELVFGAILLRRKPSQSQPYACPGNPIIHRQPFELLGDRAARSSTKKKLPVPVFEGKNTITWNPGAEGAGEVENGQHASF